jgi:Holliday junction resolvase-like predicted endonuclease
MTTKGTEAEIELKEAYESVGFECYRPPRAKYRVQDVFGEFDILAHGYDRLDAVQVKASRDAAGIRDWFDRTQTYSETLTELSRCFAHKKGEHWRIARAGTDGYVWVYDGRPSTDTYQRDLHEALRRVI